MKKLNYFLFLNFLFLNFFLINSCGLYKYTDARENPTNSKERVAKNLEEGKGVRFGNLIGNQKSGTFDFATSNEMWRASIEILDFVSFTNASYSGGLLITDWFNKDSNTNKELKITIRFLSNEIRSDALKVTLHERVCKTPDTNCLISKIETDLNSEIKLAILKKATKIKTKDSKIKKSKKKKYKIKHTKD
jgi:hypothetical protein